MLKLMVWKISKCSFNLGFRLFGSDSDPIIFVGSGYGSWNSADPDLVLALTPASGYKVSVEKKKEWEKWIKGEPQKNFKFLGEIKKLVDLVTNAWKNRKKCMKFVVFIERVKEKERKSAM